MVPVLGMRMLVRPSTARRLFDAKAWKELPFSLSGIFLLLLFMGAYIPPFYIQLYGIKNNIVGENLGFYLLPLMNAGSFFGRIVTCSPWINPLECRDWLLVDSSLHCGSSRHIQRPNCMRSYHRCSCTSVGCCSRTCWDHHIQHLLWLFLGSHNIPFTEHCGGSISWHGRIGCASRYAVGSDIGGSASRKPYCGCDLFNGMDWLANIQWGADSRCSCFGHCGENKHVWMELEGEMLIWIARENPPLTFCVLRV